METDITDHFLIFIVPKMFTNSKSFAKLNIRKRFINKSYILTFKNKFHEMKWDNILAIGHTCIAYKKFSNEFTSFFDEYFPEKDGTVKNKSVSNP